MQVILDGKTLEISEISVHLLKTFNVKPNDVKLKQQSKLKFPSEYPQINHPSTMLVIKPTVVQYQHQRKASLSISMSFPNDIKYNRLNLKLSVPNIESIVQFDQLKSIIKFGQEFELYLKQKSGRIPCIEQTFVSDSKLRRQEIDEDTLDLYGTMIKDKQNNRDFTPLLTKNKSQNLMSKCPKLETNSKSKQKKPLIKTEKLICGYLKATTKKNEYQKLKDDLKQSMMQSQHSDSMMGASQFVEQSQYQTITGVSARKQPLSISATFSLSKLSVTFILNEESTSYDCVYDSVSINTQTSHSMQPSHNLIFEDSSLIRIDQKIGYHHYNLESRNLDITFNLKHLKRKDGNPFSKQKQYSNLIEINAQLKNLQLNRYDLSNQPTLQNQFKMNIMNNQNQLESSSAQYESFSQSSGMFQSALEFFQLDQTVIGDIKNLEKSISAKRHQNIGGQSHINQSSQSQVPLNSNECSQNMTFQNMFKLNHQTQHFCRQNIIDVRSLVNGNNQSILDILFNIQQEKDNKFKLGGQVNIGSININVGYPEIILIGSIMREISGDKINVAKQKKESKMTIDCLEVQIDSIKIDVLSISNCHYNLNTILGSIIEYKPIELLNFKNCYCHQQNQTQDTILSIGLINPKIRAKERQFVINIEHCDMKTIFNNKPIELISLIGLIIDINIKQELKDQEYSMPQSHQQQEHQKTFMLFEGIDQVTDSQMDSNNLSLNQSQLESKIQTIIKIKVKSIYSDIQIDDIEVHLLLMTKLEEMIKFLLIFEDLAKCVGNERLDQNLDRTEYFLKNKRTKVPVDVVVQLSIQDAQILVTSKTNEQRAFSQISDQNLTKLLKLRLNQANIDLYLNQNQNNEKINIICTIKDLLVLDFLQNIPKYHPNLVNSEKNRDFLPLSSNLDQYFAKQESNFIEELQTSASFVLIYKQQGLKMPAFKLNIDLNFKLKSNAKDQLSSDIIASLFIKAIHLNKNNQLLQLFEDINQIKRNPMICVIEIILSALLIRLTMDQCLVLKLVKFQKVAKNLLKKLRTPPLIELNQSQDDQDDKSNNAKISEIRDVIKMTLNLEEFAIDYNPILKYLNYEKIFNDNVLNLDLSKFEDNTKKYFTTPLRGIIYIGELSLSTLKTKNSEDNEIVLKNLGLSLIQQDTIQECMNPLIFLDFNQSINQHGGQSYLDYLGFVQVLSVNLFEMKHNITKNITVNLQEANNQDQEDLINDLKQELLEQQLKQEEDDLFQTSYGLKTISNKSALSENKNELKLKQQSIYATMRKISIYLAKDSFHTLKTLAKIMDLQVEEIQNSIFQLQNLKSGKKSAKRSKKTISQSLNIDEDESIQRIIEQFLVMEYDPDEDDQKIVLSEMSQQKSQLNQSEQQDKKEDDEKFIKAGLINKSAYYYEYQNRVNDDGYFELYSGMLPEKTDPGLLYFNLNDYVKEDIIQQLTEEDIDPVRYRKCHILPIAQIDFFSQLKVYVEIETFDLKLFQGKDFDFENKEQYPPFISRDLTQNSIKNSLNQSQAKSNNLIFSIQEDYLIHTPKKHIAQYNSNLKFSQIDQSYQKDASKQLKIESQKRVRKSTRGLYFQLYIKNTAFSQNLTKDYLNFRNYRTDFTSNVFSIQNFVIKETISRKGLLIRELLQLPYSYKYDNQIELGYLYNIGEENDELGLKAMIQPFKLMLNQATITFFQQFFDIDFTPKNQVAKVQTTISNLNQQNSQFSDYSAKSHKPVYITQLKIHPFQAIFSYTSHSLNLKDLQNGNIVEFLNIFNINDLKINIKQYDLEQKLKKEQAIQHMLLFYKEDLTQNQKINFVKAIGPIRSVFNIAGAFYGVLKKPYQGYYSDKGLFKGLGEGVYHLYNVVSEESYNFTNKILDGVVKVKKAAEKRL